MMNNSLGEKSKSDKLIILNALYKIILKYKVGFSAN